MLLVKNTFLNFETEVSSQPRRHSAPGIFATAAAPAAGSKAPVVLGVACLGGRQGVLMQGQPVAAYAAQEVQEYESLDDSDCDVKDFGLPQPTKQAAPWRASDMRSGDVRFVPVEDEEEDEDDELDELPMTASRSTASMRSTASSSFSVSTVDSEASGRARKHRPCKQKRLRLKRLANKLIDQYVLRQVGAQGAEVTLPQSLMEDRKLFMKVMKEVHEGVRKVQMEQQQQQPRVVGPQAIQQPPWVYDYRR